MSTNDLIKKLNLSHDHLRLLEEKSVGQSRNTVWIKLRKGRITASNFYRVHTKMNSIRSNPNLSCENLLKSLLHPTPLDHLSQIQRGRELEASAIDELIITLVAQGHTNVDVKDCGLFIDSENQYLGASPDGVATCDCCGKTLIEIKCPTVKFNDLPYLDSIKKLKSKSLYYGQVQGQMMVTGVNKTWFFIFYPDSSSNLQLIKFNDTFSKKLRQNLVQFYELYMAPKLIFK